MQEAIDFFYSCGLMPEFWSSPGMYFVCNECFGFNPGSRAILYLQQPKKRSKILAACQSLRGIDLRFPDGIHSFTRAPSSILFQSSSSSHVIHVRNPKGPVRI